MASDIAAIRGDLTVQDPYSVYRWMNACTFEMGKLVEKVKQVHAKLSKKSVSIDYRLLNLVSNTLADLLYLRTNQLILDQSLEGISSEKRTQAVEMLLNGRAAVIKYYDPILDSVMQKLEETQIIPRILETLENKNLKKSKDNYENLASRYTECLELHHQSRAMREKIATEELFAQLQRELGFGSPAESVSLSTISSSSAPLIEHEASDSFSEDEEIDSEKMIQQFMSQPQEDRKAQFDRLSPAEKDSICEIVARLYEMWVPCSETEEELDYESAQEFLCGEAPHSFQDGGIKQ